MAPRSDHRRGARRLPAGGLELRTVVLGASSRELRISGEVDLASADPVGAAVGSALAEGARSLLVDLSRVDFIDIAGLRAVSAGAAQCQGGGCVPVLVLRPDGPVERLLHILERAGCTDLNPLAGVAVQLATEPR